MMVNLAKTLGSISLKAAEHSEFPADRSRSLASYLVQHTCTDCGHSQHVVRAARGWAAYCSCGAPMLPVGN